MQSCKLYNCAFSIWMTVPLIMRWNDRKEANKLLIQNVLIYATWKKKYKNVWLQMEKANNNASKAIT